MKQSPRRTFLHAGIGTLAVLGGCTGWNSTDENDTLRHASASESTDGTTDETTTPKPDPASNEAIRWHASGGTPAVSNGTVYSGGDAMRAFDAESGAQKWEFALDNPVLRSPTAGPKGITFRTGKQGTVGPVNVVVHCLSADGNRLFEYSKRRFPGHPNVLALTDDTVYVGFADDYLEPTGHGVCALNYDGTERWATKTGDATAGELHDDVLLVPTPTRLYALDRKTGKTRWTVDTAYSGVNHVDNDVVFIVRTANDEGVLVAVNVTDGTERWRFSGGDTIDATYGDGTVYVTNGEYRDHREFSALDAGNGKEKWAKSFDTGISDVRSTGDAVVVGTEDGTRAFTPEGSNLWQSGVSGEMTATGKTLYASGGKLTAFDAKTGTKRFEYDGADTVLKYAGDVLLLGDRSNWERTSLTALTPDGKKLWQFEAGKRLGEPVVTDDSVYLTGGDGYLYALDYPTYS